MRQTEANPWEDLANSFPVGTIVEGHVRNLTDFGAFVEITDEIDGLIHVSDMSWTKRVRHPSEVLEKGASVKARITSIDVDNQRVSLSIKEFLPNEWQEFVDQRLVGDTVEGRVVNITDFGLFVDIFEGLEGLAHVSEIDIPGTRLEDHYTVGQWVRARILRIDEDEHKVGLTMRGVDRLTQEEAAKLQAEAQPETQPEGVAGDETEESSEGPQAAVGEESVADSSEASEEAETSVASEAVAEDSEEAETSVASEAVAEDSEEAAPPAETAEAETADVETADAEPAEAETADVETADVEIAEVSSESGDDSEPEAAASDAAEEVAVEAEAEDESADDAEADPKD